MADGRNDDSARWWSARRGRYNLIALAVGCVCFMVYVTLASEVSTIDITIFTIGFQGAMALLYLLVANVFYSLAASVERRLRPADALRFRSRLFVLGVGVTIAPFLAAPLLVFYRVLFAK